MQSVISRSLNAYMHANSNYWVAMIKKSKSEELFGVYDKGTMWVTATGHISFTSTNEIGG